MLGTVYADQAKHMQLAKEFNRLSSSQNPKQLAEAYASYMLSKISDKPEHKAKLVGVLHKLITSEDYMTRKSKVFMDMFSEDELVSLIELVKMPAYKLMNSKREEYNRRLGAVASGLIQADEVTSVIEEIMKSTEK